MGSTWCQPGVKLRSIWGRHAAPYHAAASAASAATPSPAAPHSAAFAASAAASCSHRTPESYNFRVLVFVFPLTVIESKSAQFQGQNGRQWR
jgi:hypothetical protein